MEVAAAPALPTQPTLPAMPAFVGGTSAHLHSIDSALISLAAMRVPQSRIHLRRAGRDGLAPGTIVHQKPAAGEPITGNTIVQLEVAGLGFTHALPVGMWDSGGEAMAGTREILEGFDDPLEKLRHWFHEGAPLFRIAPDDLPACERWIELFGVRAADWPRSLWFRLASLIARMGQLSCSQTGCAFVLEVLLTLPVRSFTYLPNQTILPRTALTGLGKRASRLGVDFLVSDRVEDLAILKVELGPVPLATYARFVETEEGALLLARTLALVMPCSTRYQLAWVVADESRLPRLGIAEENARLGINTHLGKPLGETVRRDESVPVTETA